MPTKSVSVTLPEDLHKWAKKVAKKENVSVSRLLSSALKEHQKVHEGRTAQQEAVRDLLRDLEERHGPLDAAELENTEREVSAVFAAS